MKKKLNILIISIITLFCGQQEVSAQKNPIKFEIKQHGLELETAYKEGSVILLYCSFKNTADTDVSILLKDHDIYHGTLDYPTSITASVKDAEGKSLIEKWSTYFLWSQLTIFEEMPGDRVVLKPNEEVVRIVPLDMILRGRLDLKEGVYFVTLHLNEMNSNELKIIIGK